MVYRLRAIGSITKNLSSYEYDHQEEKEPFNFCIIRSLSMPKNNFNIIILTFCMEGASSLSYIKNLEDGKCQLIIF